MTAPTHKVMGKTGSYTDQNGQEKNRWKECGALFTNEKGQMSIHMECFLTGGEGWYSLFPNVPRNQQGGQQQGGQQNQGRQRQSVQQNQQGNQNQGGQQQNVQHAGGSGGQSQQQGQAGFDDFDDDIPF